LRRKSILRVLWRNMCPVVTRSGCRSFVEIPRKPTIYKNNAANVFAWRRFTDVFLSEKSSSNISRALKRMTYRGQRGAYNSVPDDNLSVVKKTDSPFCCMKFQECRNPEKFSSSCLNMLRINCRAKSREYNKKIILKILFHRR